MNGNTIALIVSLVGVASTFAKLISDYTKLKAETETMKRDIVCINENIKELYASRNKTNEALVKLTTILDSLVCQVSTIDKKLDDLKKDLKGV